VPYQLHCSPETTGVLLLEREDVVATLEGAELVVATDELVVVVPEQILPVSVGTSPEPPRLSTWKPKVALWPGCNVPFQLRFEAV
jgi:hypothetical protein